MKQAKKNARKPKQQPKPKSRAKNRSGLIGLDRSAREYAKLLNDPCYASIVRPVYDSPGTGQMVRVESDFILGAEATSVGAAIFFVPGVLSASAAYGSVGIPTTVVNSDTATIVWQGGTAFQPGYSLRGGYSAVRAISACAQLSFVGSELNRAGVVSMAQMTVAEASTLTTVAAIRSASERVVKMPDGVLEIKLAPNSTSPMFSPISGADSYNQQPCLVLSASGIPSSTGVRIRLITVFELMPNTGSGIMSSTATSESQSTLGVILGAMQKANPQWRYELLTGLGAYAAKAITWI